MAGPGTDAGGNASPEEDLPRGTAPEVGEGGEDARPEAGIGRSTAARLLRQGRL